MLARLLIVIAFLISGCASQMPPSSTNAKLQSQNNTAAAEFRISIAAPLQDVMSSEGRIFLFLSKDDTSEPRQQLWPLSENPNFIFAKNLTLWSSASTTMLNQASNLMSNTSFDLSEIPKGRYSMQVLWHQNASLPYINAEGNLYSEVAVIDIDSDFTESIVLSKQVPTTVLVDHPLVKKVTFKSELLSEFWQEPFYISASVLLPNTYEQNSQQTYPIRYNVAGYGGRYTRVERLINSEDFMQWWQSDEAPQIITVYLDSLGPFGDNYQLDSANNGPFGQSLVSELIPTVEAEFRTKNSAKYRFTDGCSTGGWVSLALQLFYPDTFNGAFSYSPDSIDFSAYQLANIYEDTNVFYNKWGNLRPVARTVYGDPIITLKNFIQYENVQGVSNDYRTSGGQFSAHTSLYSPKGEDGLPMPMFDPQTGAIDPQVAEAWKKYDLKLFTEQNWSELGPKLQDKIYIWMGDMDHFFLNPATRKFAQYLEGTTNPTSNATIDFTPMAGHCSKFSDKLVLEQIQTRLLAIDK